MCFFVNRREVKLKSLTSLVSSSILPHDTTALLPTYFYSSSTTSYFLLPLMDGRRSICTRIYDPASTSFYSV
ncbi:MAG: hypothetical protein ACRC6V_02925 [Bacteroidales bacterium]